MDSVEILKVIQQIALDQGKIVASLNGHVELDNERFSRLNEKLEELEAKVDRLLDFRGWVLGAVAVISAGISTLVALLGLKFK